MIKYMIQNEPGLTNSSDQRVPATSCQEMLASWTYQVTNETDTIFAASKRNPSLSGLENMMEEEIRHYLEKPQNILWKPRASAYVTAPEESPARVSTGSSFWNQSDL